MPFLVRSVVLFALVGVAACATSNRPTTVAGPARWTGNFKSMGGTSAVMTATTNTQASAFGNITIVTLDTAPPTSRVDLYVTAPAMSGSQLAWAVFSGPCGAPTPPVAGVNEFPTMELTSGGGRIGTSLRFRLSPGTEYHTNVYNSGRATDVSNVMLCANLTLGR